MKCTSRAVVSKPSGGIRSLPSLSALGLPTPVVALACIGNVDFLRCCLCKWVTLFLWRLQACIYGSPLGHPKGVPCAELASRRLD